MALQVVLEALGWPTKELLKYSAVIRAALWDDNHNFAFLAIRCSLNEIATHSNALLVC